MPRARLSLALVVPLLLVLLVATIAGVGAFVLRAVFLDSFERLEISAATLDLERFVSGLSHEMDDLSGDVSAAVRHAASLAGAGESAARIFAASDYFAELRLNIACVYGADRNVLSARVHDETGRQLGAGNPMELCHMPADHPLMSLVMKPDGFAGLFDSDYGAFMLVAVPTKPAAAGAGDEHILAGRIFDTAELQRITRTNHISIDFWSMRSPDLQVLDAAAGAAVSLGQAFVVNSKDENILQVYRAIPDVLGTPAFLARANIQRELREIGTRTTTLAVAGMVYLGISVIVLTIVLMRYLMVLPLAELTRHILRLRHHGDTGVRLRFRRRDEIGLLADAFSSLLDDLDETSRRFADASYRAGQAENAEGLLHNVGNVLNSLSVSAHAVLERIRSMRFDRMEAAAAELGRADGATGRQQKLMTYLQLGLAETHTQFDSLTNDVDRVIRNIERIETILEGQRQFSFGDKALAPFRLGRAVEDAVSMLPAKHQQQIEIDVDASVQAAPLVLGQRPAVVQILVNLLKNAAESIEQRDHASKRIGIAAAPTIESDRPMVEIQVSDNGVGFAEGDAVRIFQRGFSTKSEGGRGIGLHWSAGMAAGMQGHLRAQSQGVGGGAVFRLTLPAAEVEK